MGSSGEGAEDQADPSALVVLSLPWVFTQSPPTDTADFIKEAGRMGVRLDEPTLRALYRHGLLVPLVAIRQRRVEPRTGPLSGEHLAHGTRLTQLRQAREEGRLLDLGRSPYLRRLEFQSSAPSSDWWNGIVYSRFQLLGLTALREALGEARTVRRQGARPSVTLRQRRPGGIQLMGRYRRLALVLTALEAGTSLFSIASGFTSPVRRSMNGRTTETPSTP